MDPLTALGLDVNQQTAAALATPVGVTPSPNVASTSLFSNPTNVLQLAAGFTGDALALIKGINSPASIPSGQFAGYTPAQVAAQNAAAMITPNAPSTFSGPYFWLLIVGVGILVLALGAKFLKK